MKNKKILVVGVMLSLLGIGNIGECGRLEIGIPYINNAVRTGDFIYKGDTTFSTSGIATRAINIGTPNSSDMPSINLTIAGKIRYQPPNNGSDSSWGVILASGYNGGPIYVHVDKSGYIETTGREAKGIFLAGPNVHILNQGKIVIKKYNFLPEIFPSCYGIFLEQGADCINEGEIEVTGVNCSACIVVQDDKKARPPVKVVNKGTLRALHETTGILLMGVRQSESFDIINEGKIIAKDKARGILLASDPQNRSRFSFTNSGSISAEKSCCINSPDKRTSGTRNTVTLQAKSDLLSTGENGIAVVLVGSVGNSVGDNTVKNTGKNSTSFYVKDSTLEIKNGTLSVANEGVGGKGFIITERGNLNITKDGIKIDSPLKDPKNLTDMSYGVRVEKASSGKINKGTFLTINTHKIGEGAVQVADKSTFSNEGDLTIVSHHAKANGMGIDNAKVNFVGNTNISSQQDGINGKKNSNLFMNGMSKTTVKAKGIGLKLEENSVANNAGTSVLNIEMANAANQGTGISLKNKSTFNSKGKVSITGNHETKEGYALEGHSVLNLEGETTLTNVKEGFALKDNSVLNLNKGSQSTLTDNQVGIKVSNNSALNSAAGSTLTITSTKADAKGIELSNGAKGRIEGNIALNSKGNGNTAFRLDKADINFMPAATVAITMEGNNNKAICASNQSNVTSDPTSNLNITLKGEENQAIFAEQQGTTTGTNEVTLNNSKINIEGKNSTAAYAKGQQSIITLNAVDIKCAKDNEFYRVEEGGTINLVNMENQDASMGTLSSGTINLNNTTWKGEVFHGKKGTSAMGDVGALNIHLNNSAFVGTTKMYSTNTLAKINVSIEPGAAWIIPDNNKLQGTLRNEGKMTFYNPHFKDYKTLEVDDYASTAGSIVFTTDFANQVGDKLIIKNATQKSTGNISVADKSLLTDEMVMGSKRLLLVEDPSGQTQWQGKALDTGGIWEVTPKVERGDALGLANTNWYLNYLKFVPAPKIKNVKKVIDNKRDVVKTLITDNTLEERGTEILENVGERTSAMLETYGNSREKTAVGDLYTAVPEAGIWTKIQAGEREGRGIRNKYQRYQIGYDKMQGKDILYGLAVSHSRGTTNLARGSGKDHFTALSLYGMKYLPNGFYHGLVLHGGKLRGDTQLFSPQPEQFKQSSWCYGGNYSFGKKFKYKKGWYIEPQGKIGYMYLGGQEFTSDRGMRVRSDRVHSVLGRTGVVLGRKTKMGDYFLKAHMLREFKGRGGVHASALNKRGVLEQGSFSRDYKDSWYEIGVGTRTQLSPKTYFYGDFVKSFGADICKKWQGTVGLKFAF